MLDETTRAEIKELVQSIIAANALEFRRSSSSTEIGMSASGKPTFSIKVYGNNPTENTNRARIIERQLSAQYLSKPFEQPEPYPEPTAAELGQMEEDALAGGRLKSPTDYARSERPAREEAPARPARAAAAAPDISGPSDAFNAAVGGGASVDDYVDTDFQELDGDEPF